MDGTGSLAALLAVAQGIAAGAPLPSPEDTASWRTQLQASAPVIGPEARGQLQALLLGSGVEAALQWLHDVGILALILPELEVTVDFAQEVGRRHKDVWKHTKQVVAQAALEPLVRWAALLHDIGKVETRAFTPQGKVTFHGHAEAGARLFDRISRRLGFAKPERTRVRFLILHHLRANQYDGKWTDSAVRRFDREMAEHLQPLLALSRADITSARRQRREQAIGQIDELWQRIQVLREIDSRIPPLPSGLGNAIMERFSLPPGRIIGELRRTLELAIDEEQLEPRRESDYYLEYLERAGLLPRGAPQE